MSVINSIVVNNSSENPLNTSNEYINYVIGMFYHPDTLGPYPGADYILESEYIPVNNGDVVKWHCYEPGMHKLILYNSSHTALSNYSSYEIASDGFRTITLNNENVKFIRGSFLKSDTNACILVNGEYKWKRTDTSLSKVLDIIPFQFNKNIINGNGVKPLKILHFSDIHGSDDAFLRIRNFYSTYYNQIDLCIHTGDTVTSQFTSGWDFWNDSAPRYIFNVVGNHDCAKYESGTWTMPYVGTQELYSKVLAWSYYWKIKQPLNAEENGICYYYKDYTSSNIRLIALDDMLILTNTRKEEELTWLEETLSDAIENNLQVIIACHYTPATTPIDCTFQMIGNNSGGYDNWLQSLVIQKVTQFIASGGEFICYICGHKHADVFGLVEGTTDQLVISVSTANWQNQALFDDIERNVNDKTYDLFNLMRIDSVNKILSLYRVGSNFDCYGRHIGSLTYNYGTHTLLSNW